MKPGHPPERKDARETANEVCRMGLLLVAIGLVVCLVGMAAWHRHSLSHYLLMVGFGAILCLSGVYTWINGKQKH